MVEPKTKPDETSLFSSSKSWQELLTDDDFCSVFFSNVLEKYIQKQRWYGGKSSQLKYIELSEYFKIQQDGEVYFGLILEVNFVEAFYHHYFLPIAFVSDENYVCDGKISRLKLRIQKGFLLMRRIWKPSGKLFFRGFQTLLQ